MQNNDIIKDIVVVTYASFEVSLYAKRFICYHIFFY